MDLIARKKALLLNAPHKEIKTGSFVQFETDMKSLMEITGSGNVTNCGKNLFDELYTNIPVDVSTVYYYNVFVGNNTVTMSTTNGRGSGGGANLFLLKGKVSSGGSTSTDGVWSGTPRTVTAENGYVTIAYRSYRGADPRQANTMLNIGSSIETYEPFIGETSATLTGRKTHAGTNYVFSDSGDVTVEYWTH